MGYLIDTNIWVAIERGLIDPADLYALTKHEPIFISPINIAELQYGLQLMADGESKTRAAVHMRKIRRKPLLRITAETGVVFGNIAAILRKQGGSADHRPHDIWLAAQAIQRKLRLATANPKDFQDVPGLDLLVVKL